MGTLHTLRYMAVVVAMLRTAAPSAAVAEAPPAQPPEPPSAAFVLAPSIGLTDVGLDTNILATSVQPRRDFTATLRLQLDPVSRLGPARIRGRAGVSLNYFQQYTTQRSADPEGAIRVDLAGSRVSAYALGSSVRLRDPYGPEIDIRVRRQEQTVEAGVDVRLSDRTSCAAALRRLDLAFNGSEYVFDTSLREALDRTVDMVMASARHRLTPLTSVVAIADLQRDRFDLSPGRDASSWRVLGGLEFRPTALIAGRAHVGYRQFVPLQSADASIGATAASVDLTYTLADSFRFGVRMDRDLSHSYSLVERYFVWTDVRLLITRRVNRALDITGEVGRRRLSYRGAPGSGQDAEPVDRLFRMSTGVEYRVGNNATVGIDAEYYRRSSDLVARDYDRLRLVSSVGYHF